MRQSEGSWQTAWSRTAQRAVVGVRVRVRVRARARARARARVRTAQRAVGWRGVSDYE